MGALGRQLPAQPRPFRLPGGHVLPYLAFLASSLLVFWAGWAINEKVLIALLVGYAVFAIYSAVARDRMPPLDFKAGSWFPIWIGGLAVISYLGDIDPTSPADPGVRPSTPTPLPCGCPPRRAAAHISQLPTDEPQPVLTQLRHSATVAVCSLLRE